MYKTASITQSTIDWKDKNWIIMNDKWWNIDILPDCLNHLPVKSAMEILHLTRKVEQNSYKKWLSDQMVISSKKFDEQSDIFRKEIARLNLANKNLSETVVKNLFDNEI